MATPCPKCGAQNAGTAQWCNQCYESLLEPKPQPEPESVSERGSEPEQRRDDGVEAETDSAVADQRWTCPVCEERNPISVARCQTCGTDMIVAFTPPAEKMDGSVAKLWSGIPGGGHAKAGNGLTGVSVFLLVAMAVGFGLALLSGAKTNGIGIVILTVGAGVWVFSAYDVQRHIDTGSPWLLQGRVVSSIAGLITSLLIIAVLLAV